MPKTRTLVVGPAYLDRVLRVDRPLIAPNRGGVLDRSVSGLHRSRQVAENVFDQISIADPSNCLLIRSDSEHPILVSPLPDRWPGPVGLIDPKSPVAESPTRQEARIVTGIAWQDDLGGMGAGYAHALGGLLVWIAGDADDLVTASVERLMDSLGIAHQPVRVSNRGGEWTLLVTSGPFGDKLAVGIRTMGDVEIDFSLLKGESCDLLVAASMTNARASSAFEMVQSNVRFFAPSIRNMTDCDPPVSLVCKLVDILSCNSLEWNSLPDREQVAWKLSVLIITDGPRGATIRYTDEHGEPGILEIPAFPRRNPPRDTNRAGEAFGSTFVQTLLGQGWRPGTASRSLIQLAAERASVAAALVLDRLDFGFPSSEEIDRARIEGIVG